MKTIIKLDVPEYQIGQEVSIYFKDTMMIKGVVQKPKTGHWKRISIDKYVQHAMAYYKCSVCDKDIIGTHNYCPNCGAKMSEIPTSPERNGKEESEVEE